MNYPRIEIQTPNGTYPAIVGSNMFELIGESISAFSTVEPHKIVIVSDDIVSDLYCRALREKLPEKYSVFDFSVPNGENSKNLDVVSNVLTFFSEIRLKRTDLVIALGGGVVGDIAGFCSSIYMRGVPYLQIPTTLLAMVDSSVGGKTGVNNVFGKNMIGSFYHPVAVFADVKLLKTLDIREVKAGYYELIKHGAIGGNALLNKTRLFLERYPLGKFTDYFGDAEFEKSLANLLLDQIDQKARIVAQDQNESPERSDNLSRKILNFGHTAGHALELVTNYEYFRHGEAVGYGILIAVEMSKKLDICDSNSINLLNDVVAGVGDLPGSADIDVDEVYEAIAFDKKSAGNSNQWVLLEAIGNPLIISGQDIPSSVIREALAKVLQT